MWLPPLACPPQGASVHCLCAAMGTHVSQAITPFWPPVLTPALGTPPFFLAFLPPSSECCAYFLSSKQTEAKPERGGRKARLGRTWKTTKDSTQRHGQCTPAVNLSPLDPVYLHPRGPPTNTPSSSELKKPGFERLARTPNSGECNNFVPTLGGRGRDGRHIS